MILQCPVLKDVLSLTPLLTQIVIIALSLRLSSVYLAQLHGIGWPGSPETSAVFCSVQVANFQLKLLYDSKVIQLSN